MPAPGWANGTLANFLALSTQSVYSVEQCGFEYNPGSPALRGFVDLTIPHGFQGHLMCAKHRVRQNTQDTHCQGDSGGPLLSYTFKNGLNKVEQIGVTCCKANIKECDPKYPSIYARMEDEKVFNWIQLRLATGKLFPY